MVKELKETMSEELKESIKNTTIMKNAVWWPTSNRQEDRSIDSREYQ